MDAFVGEWNVEASLPIDPPIEMRGRSVFEWLEGGGFLVQRSTTEREEFPNTLSVIGVDEEGEGYVMHYFDSRGVKRVYEMSLADGVWKLERDPSGPRSDFWQRYVGEFSDDGKTIEGRWEKSDDGSSWELDFPLTYTKQ
ncbi:MAG: hypothetical protein ACXWDQ_01245 [Solirubrobacterales bacterium]